MSIPDARKFLETISGFTRQPQGTPKSADRPNKLATIDPAYVSGSPKVKFDGESTLSTKTYKRIGSYTPVANDRVLLIPVGSTYVILGKIV